MKYPDGSKIPAWRQNLQLMSDPLRYLDRLGQQYGHLFTTAFGPISVVLVSDPEALKEIFTNTKEITAPGDFSKILAPIVGTNGLLLLSGAHHRQRRKLLMPAFHGMRIQAYVQQICALTRQTFDRLPVGKPFLAYPTLQTIALDLITEVVFGLQTGVRDRQLKRLLPLLMNCARSPYVELALAIPALQRDLGKWSPWGYFLYLRHQFEQLLDDEINERRRQADSTRPDVLTELIFARDETGRSLTNEEIRDIFPSLLFAGRDASSAALSWVLYWVHRLPEVRDRLLQELSDLGELPEPLKIVQLPYLTAVCNEALRIYPTQVVTFPRRVESPVELMGYHLEPGTVIRGNIYLTHQRPDLYPNPQEFRPERFLERQFSAYEFLPFGGGTRRCPGEVLALFEMKLILATILSHYQLTLATQQPEYPKRRGVNFPPKGGVKAIVTARRAMPSTSLMASVS
ncbi:cytochrome P450 [Chroococcidiopsis sp. CCNUC1]|uniref:cytochrome P450 n=1 Tax=Chroococcidiopsis sp. CCNUC1 TaxID=2653189 RepID=UPI00201FC2C5|nr:cytochrome P450 [Chroococcidiopsis sp. CCNUC1]URD53875.1 cytochrome P450 [Chroococcidiopsis sp. CCNUC1]